MKNDNLKSFFIKKDNSIIFNGNYMEVYIPYYYFENKMTNIFEDKINTLGIFLFRIYKDESKKDNAQMQVYKLPTVINLKPSNYRKDKLTINGTTMDYFILEFFKNDVFIDSTIIVQSSSIVNDLITFFHNGKLPTFLKYEDTFKLILNSILINKMKFKVPAVTFETMNSEINRNKSDISKPFRFAAADGANERDYQPVSIKQIPNFNSTFSSVTFEDIDYQLIASVNRTKYKKEETLSPIEETIKY